MKKTVVAISIIMFWANPLVAAEYYVAPNGKDSSPGTSSSPWASIAKANTALQPGDTVYIKGGEYREVIKPGKSGQPGKYITYKAAPGETPVITDSPGNIAINLDNRSYIRVDGMKADGKALADNANLKRWVTLRNANYNIIENSDFKYATGWSCVAISDGSHHNQIRNNRMDFCGAYSSYRASDNTYQDSGDLIDLKEGSPNNLIEGNHLTHGGHNLITFDSSFNIIRNNYLNNDWSDVEGAGKGNRCMEIRAQDGIRGFNVVEGNILTGTGKPVDKDNPPPAIKVEGNNQIIRKNFIINNELVAVRTLAWTNNPYSRDNKIYNNIMYNNGGGAWLLRHTADQGSIEADYNIFKNNIAFNNKQNPGGSSFNYDINIDLNVGDSLKNNRVISNSIFGSDGKSIIKVKGISTESVQWYQSNYPNNYSGNIEENPQFVSSNPGEPEEFRLKSSSRLIDAGDYLTKTKDSGTNGVTVGLEDAGYFTDGFGLIEGDLVQIGTNTPVRIQKVDYSGNRITLQKPITWRSGDAVSLPYSGSRPDIGAYEFGNAVATAPPSPPTFQ